MLNRIFALQKMNLIIDIGNTQAKLAVFHKDIMVEKAIIPNGSLRGLKEFALANKCERGIVASVIDLEEKAEAELSSLSIPLLRFSTQTKVPISIAYRTPQTLGTDRLAAVVGAIEKQPNRDILIIDAGTCITYELVNAKGIYLGGNISPGINIRLQSLQEHTGRLPLVKAEGETPDIGFDTQTAIRSGVINGIAKEIDGYIEEFGRKYPGLFVFLTGGDYGNFVTRTKNAIFADNSLVPYGLNRILDYNDK